MKSKVNIIIPMAGLGSRFQQAGFSLPKPLIKVINKPMYSWAVDSLPLEYTNKLIFVLLSSEPKFEELKKDIGDRYKKFNPIILDVTKLTEGQSATVLMSKDYINNDVPLLIHNADTAFDIKRNWLEDILNNDVDGALLVFNSNEPRWSYSREDAKGSVVEVREKKVISNFATTGTYYFRYGFQYVSLAEDRISKKLKEANEYYIAPLYNDMIEKGAIIKNILIDKLYCFGTPEDLVTSLNEMNNH